MEEDTRGNGYPTGQEGTKGNGYPTEQEDAQGSSYPTEQEDARGSGYPTEQEDARGSGYPTEQEGSSETQDTIDKALIDLLMLAKILKEKISHQKMPHTKSDQQVSSGTWYSCRSHQQTKSAPAGRSVSRDVHPVGSTVGRTSETQISPDSLHKSPMKKKIHSGNYPCHVCWKHGIHPSSVHNQREGIEQLRRTQSQHRKQTHSSTHKMEPNPRDRPGDTVNPSIVHHRDRPGDTANHCQKAYTSVSPAAPKASNESATNHNSSALQIRDTQHIPSVPSQTYDSQPGKYRHLEVQATSVKPVVTNRQESTVKQSEMTDGADNMHTSNSQSKSVNVDKKLDGRPISEFSQVQSTKSGYKLTANDSQRYSTSYNSTSHKTQTSPKLTTEQMHISHPQQSPQSLTAHGKEYGNSMHKNQHSKSTTQKAAANDNTSHKTNNSQCREKTHTKSHHSISKVSVTNPSSKNEEISRSGKLKSSSSAKCLEPLKIPSSAQKKCENSITAQYPPGIQKTLEAIASKLTMINADCRAASSSGKSSFKSKAKNSLQVKSTERKSITDLIDEVKSTKLHQKDKKSQSCTQERSRSRDKDSVNVQTDANSSKDASHVGSNRQENKVNLKKSKEDVTGKESSKRKSSNKVSFENHVNSSENQLKKSEIQDHHQNSTLHKNNKTQDQNLSIEDLGLDEDLPVLVRSRRYSDKQRQTHHKTHTPESETKKHSTDSVHTGNNENMEIHHNVNDVVKVGDIATAEHKDTRTIESKHQSSQEKSAMQEDNSNKIDEKLDVNHKASGKDEQNFENASDCIEAGICCKFLNFLSRSQSIKNIPSESMCDGAKTNPDNTKHSKLSAKRQKHIQGTTEIREKGIGYHINETDVKGQESDKNSAINKSQTNIGESSAEDVNKHINLILTNIKKEPEWNISPSESLNHKTNETRSESQSQKKDSGRNIWEDLRLQQDQRLHHEPGSKQLLQHTTEETIQTPGENPTKEKMQIKEPKKSNSGEVQLTWQQLMKPIPESPQTERKPTLKSIIKTEPVSPAIPTSNHAPSLRNETESGEQNTFIKTEPVSPTILTDNHYQSLTNGKQSGQQSCNITQLDNLQGGKDEHKSDDADRLQENTQTKESMYKQNQDKNIQKSNKQTEEVKIQNVNAKQTPENDMNHAAESDSIPHNSTEVPTHTEIQQPNSMQVNKDNTKETDTTSRDKNISTQASPNESASETIICKDTKNVLITTCSGDKESENILQTGNNLNEQQIEVKREVNPSADPFPVSDFGKSSKDSTVIKPQISPIRSIPDMQGIENGDKAVDPGESKNSNEESSSTCNIVQGDRKDETSTCNIVQGDRKDETKKKASTDQQRYLKSSIFCQSEEKSPMIRKTTANKRIVMLKSTFLPQFSSNQFKNPSVSNSTDEINNPNIKRNESNSTACKHIVQSEKKKKKSISSIVVSVNANKTVRKTTKQTREQSVARQIVKKRIASTPARSLKSSSIGSKRLLQQNTRTMTSREKEISIKSFKKEIKHKSRDSERNLKNTDETFGNRSSIRDNERGTRQSNTVCSCLRCTCERRELGQSQRYSDRYREKSPDDKYRRYWPRFTSPDRNNYNRDDYWTHETRVYERYPRRESSPPLPSSSGERESWNSRYDVYRRDRFLYHRSQSTAYIGRSPRTPSPPYQWTPPSSRSRSPPHRLRSPLPRSRSPIYRSASPKRRSRSPKLRSRSPKRKSKSPVYRGYVAPRSKSLSSWPPEPQWSSFSSDSTVLNFKDRKKTEPSTVRSQSNSMSTKKIRQDTLTTAKPSKPSNKSQRQTPTQNNLNNPLSKNSTVTGKMEDVKETEIMAKVSSSSSTCDASTDSDKIIANSLNRANQLQTIQVKMDHSRRLSNLIQIDTSSFEVGNKTVNTLSKPNQSNTSRTDTKGEDLKSNNKLKMTENTRQKTANDTQTLGVSDKIKDTADVLQNTNKISEVDLEKRTDIKEVTKVTDTEKPKVKNIERQNSEQNLKDEKKKIFSIPDKQSSEQMEYGKPQNISDENKEKSTEMTKEIKNDVSATVNLVPMMKMGKVPVDFVMQESSNKVKKIMAMENMAINVESETKHTVVKATEHALNETQAVEPETTSDALHTGDKNGNVDSKIKGHAQDVKEATDQQPQNKLENKTPLKNNNKEVKDEKPNVNSKSPTTPPNQYIDINLKNMTHIYASDGQQVCNAFNMSKISGSDCPGTCNQHHLSLPLYNSYTKTDMSVSQTEEIEVLRDAKGNACFFNMSQKMICNNFNSDDGCKNKNCFMVHLSFYNIFYSYFRRKLKCQTSPTCVERGHKSLPGTNAASHTDNKLCKPVMEAAIQCEEQVEKTSIHKKDQNKEKSQYTSVEKCCMENQTSVNEDSTKRFQKDLSTHHQADKGGKQEPGKPTTSKNEPTKPENSDNNQTDLLKTEQSISSDPKTYDPTCKGNVRDIERTSHSMTISGEYKDDMVTVINVKTVRRYPVCKFFNTPRGCQRWNCRYQHVKNKTKYHSKQKHNTYSPNFIWSNRKRQQNTFLAAGQKQPEKMKKFDIQPRKLNEQKCEKTSAQEPAICKNTESQEKKLNSKADQESGINNQNKIIPCAERNVSTPREAPNLSENSGKIGTEYGMNEKERSNQNTTGDERKTKDTTAISTVTENKVTKYTKSAPTSIKRKQDYDMPHRAAKIPRQNRDFNWQALLARQHSTLNHNNYNYHQANTTLASEQNNMAERWRPDMAERLCPDFNTPWGCRYPHWACSYIHDYADDVQF